MRRPLKPCVVLIVASLEFAFSLAALAHEGHKAEHNHPYPTKIFSVRNGKAIYNIYCVSCHGERGNGNGPAAASQKTRPTNLLHLKYMPMRWQVDHYEAIADGRPNTTMVP